MDAQRRIEPNLIASPALAVQPAYLWVPPYEFTSGPEVADLCEMVGFGPDPVQRLCLDAIHAEHPNGLPVVFETCTIGCRQNFKTGVQTQATLGWSFLLNVQRVVYTAHDWNPACKDMFAGLKQIIGGSSWLSRRVRRIYEGNGEEEIAFKSGAQILFRTRTKGGGRSMAADKIILDEGLYLEETHESALIPTLSTRQHRQLLTGSSAGLAKSARLRDRRDRGRASALDPERGDMSLAYVEFCADDPEHACARGALCDHGKRTPGCGMDDPEQWRKANPAMGIRITEKTIRDERRSLSPHSFGVERMGWWEPADDDGETSPISIDRWDELEDDDPDAAPQPLLTYAVEVDRDMAWSTIAAAGIRVDDRVHVEVAPDGRRRGIGWIVEYFQDLRDAYGAIQIAVDGGGPAKSLIQPLRDAGFDVVVLGLADVYAAFTWLMEQIRTGRLVHGPQSSLQSGVIGARKRLMCDGAFTLGRKNSESDVTPIVGAMLAGWLVDELDYDVLDSAF